MESCCPLCYSKYLRPDGSVDEVAFRLEVEKHLTHLARLNNLSKRARIKLITESRFDPKTACRCDCHVIGSNTLH